MVSFTVAGITCGIARNMLNNSKQGSITIGLTVPLSAGLLKEWYDLKHPKTHRASIKDLLVGCVGAVAGVAVVMALSS